MQINADITESEMLSIIQEAKSSALSHIYQEYQDREVPHKLFYHDTLHTMMGCKRVQLLAYAMSLNHLHTACAVVGMSRHDYHLVCERRVVGTKVMRYRAPRVSERLSADAAGEYMEQHELLGRSPGEPHFVRQGILATYAEFDPNYHTVRQLDLSRHTHPITRAIPLADLGAAGMDPDLFLADCPMLFAEDNIDIMEALTSQEEVPVKYQLECLERYFDFAQLQAPFAQGRQELLSKELDGLPHNAFVATERLFSRFSESIMRAEEAAKRAHDLTFSQLRSLLLSRQTYRMAA